MRVQPRRIIPNLLAAIFVVAALAALSLEARESGDTPLRVIDIHTHPEFGREIAGVDDSSREAFLQEWEEAGLVGAVGILHTQNGFTPDLGDRPMVYCAGLVDDPDIPALDKGLTEGTYGCIKIYLGYVHRWAYDPVYEPVYKLAEKHDVPVIFHTGDTSSSNAKLKYADPLTVDEVAVDHPKVRFVIAHCGYPWIESAAEVTYKNPNVYIECSAMLVGDVSTIEESVVDEWMVRSVRWIFGYIEDPSKMMFGSDWPLVRIGPYLEAYKRAIPKEHWKAVFHDNAVRVFRIEQVANNGEEEAGSGEQGASPRDR